MGNLIPRNDRKFNPALFARPADGDGFALIFDGHTMEYLKDPFRHCKPILALGASRKLLEMAGVPASTGKDPGLLLAERNKAADAAPAFIAAIAAHRHPSRDSDPPRI